MMDGAMIGEVSPAHHARILANNATYVHWLSPLDQAGLDDLLSRAHYARQIGSGQAVLIGYAHDADYTDAAHKNLRWLRARLERFFYIDRVIVSADAQGQGLGRALYHDFEAEARRLGLPRLVCEVNTKPDNPGSHRFHMRFGFRALADVAYPDYDAALRYYEKPLD